MDLSIKKVILFREKISGTWITFFESGQRKIIENYSNDVLNGDAKYFYDNGNLIETGYFRQGKKTGQWLSYNLYGELVNRREYISGKIILENGKLTKHYSE